MHSGDQDIFIMRSVKYRKLPFFWQNQIMPPQVIVPNSLDWCFKTMHHNSSRIEFLKLPESDYPFQRCPCLANKLKHTSDCVHTWHLAVGLIFLETFFLIFFFSCTNIKIGRQLWQTYFNFKIIGIYRLHRK
jgi:hypothetical protein